MKSLNVSVSQHVCLSLYNIAEINFVKKLYLIALKNMGTYKSKKFKFTYFCKTRGKLKMFWFIKPVCCTTEEKICYGKHVCF